MDILKGCGFDCDEDRVTAGLARTRVPGRMEMVSERPRILVDGAHNPASVNALMRLRGGPRSLRQHGVHLRLLRGQGRGGDAGPRQPGRGQGDLHPRATTPRAADPEELQKAFQERLRQDEPGGAFLADALALATRAVSRDDLIVVTGSFYLVGEAIKLLHHERQRAEA